MATLNAGLIEALTSIAETAERPIGTDWRLGGDDLCDCTFQTVWETTNPYIGKTQRVRVCCILEKLQTQYPEFVALLDGWHDVGRQQLNVEPLEWDHESMAMPPRLWFRQIATKTGLALDMVRQMYSGRESERPGAGRGKTFQVASDTELAAAREAELRATGWLL